MKRLEAASTKGKKEGGPRGRAIPPAVGPFRVQCDQGLRVTGAALLAMTGTLKAFSTM